MIILPRTYATVPEIHLYKIRFSISLDDKIKSFFIITKNSLKVGPFCRIYFLAELNTMLFQDISNHSFHHMTATILSGVAVKTCLYSENVINQVVDSPLSEYVGKSRSFKVFYNTIYACKEPVKNDTLTGRVQNSFLPLASHSYKNIHNAECRAVTIPYSFNASA